MRITESDESSRAILNLDKNFLSVENSDNVFFNYDFKKNSGSIHLFITLKESTQQKGIIDIIIPPQNDSWTLDLKIFCEQKSRNKINFLAGNQKCCKNVNVDTEIFLEENSELVLDFSWSVENLSPCNLNFLVKAGSHSMFSFYPELIISEHSYVDLFSEMLLFDKASVKFKEKIICSQNSAIKNRRLLYHEGDETAFFYEGYAETETNSHSQYIQDNYLYGQEVKHDNILQSLTSYCSFFDFRPEYHVYSDNNEINKEHIILKK